MSEFKNVLSQIYDKFLMRDIFAKIIPGFIFLSSLCYCLFNRGWLNHNIFSSSNILWFIILGISWILSFAVQSFGEQIGLIKYYSKSYSNWKEWYEDFIKFRKLASKDEQEQVERFIVIKETCGNFCSSRIFSSLVIFLFIISKMPILSAIKVLITYWPAVITLIAIIYFLKRMHNIHVDRQCDLVKVIIENEKKSNPSFKPDYEVK